MDTAQSATFRHSSLSQRTTTRWVTTSDTWTQSIDATIPTALRQVNAIPHAGMLEAVEVQSAILPLITSSGMSKLKRSKLPHQLICAVDLSASMMTSASMVALTQLNASTISHTATHHTWFKFTMRKQRLRWWFLPEIDASSFLAWPLISALTAMIATMALAWTSTISATGQPPINHSMMLMENGLSHPQKTDAWVPNATTAFSALSIINRN